MVDVAALRTDLENNAVYDADVRKGSNSSVLRRLLSEDARLPRRWRPISRDDFLSAVAAENLTAAQERRIQTYTQEGQDVPMHKQGVRDWVLGQRFAPATIQALEAVGQVTGKPADAFLSEDEDSLGLREVREAVAQIAKAHINNSASKPVRVEP